MVQHPGHGGSYEPPHSKSHGTRGFLHLPGCKAVVQVLLVSDGEKVMSWQNMELISLERGYLIPRSLLHLGPLVKQILFTPGTLPEPLPSDMVSEIRIIDSLDEIARTVAPFPSILGYSESPRCPLSKNTQVYGFMFSGCHEGACFLVLPLLGNIS